MKGLVATAAVLMTVIAAIVLAIVELLIKLAPLLVAAACLWGSGQANRRTPRPRGGRRGAS